MITLALSLINFGLGIFLGMVIFLLTIFIKSLFDKDNHDKFMDCWAILILLMVGSGASGVLLLFTAYGTR